MSFIVNTLAIVCIFNSLAYSQDGADWYVPYIKPGNCIVNPEMGFLMKMPCTCSKDALDSPGRFPDDDEMCQLVWDKCMSYDSCKRGTTIGCKPNASQACKDQFKVWAKMFREAPNASSCKDTDPLYNILQEADTTCN